MYRENTKERFLAAGIDELMKLTDDEEIQSRQSVNIIIKRLSHP